MRSSEIRLRKLKLRLRDKPPCTAIWQQMLQSVLALRGCMPRIYLFVSKPSIQNRNSNSTIQDQDQRSKVEVESHVQSMCDDVLRAVSIPVCEMHHWKEDSCSPNLDGILCKGQREFNHSAAALHCQCSFAKPVHGPFRVTVLAFTLQPGKTMINSDRNTAKGAFILIAIGTKTSVL